MKARQNNHHYAVIMAGGSGTRLWPMSRKDLPKQMQSLISDKTLINETVERLLGVVTASNIYISTTANYAERIGSLLPEIPPTNIIVEPVARGTAAALALVSLTILNRDPDAIIYYVASDHAISDVAEFRSRVNQALKYVERHPQTIVLTGLEPQGPNTGFGYIKKSQSLSTTQEIFAVEKFVEKPTLAVAKKYVQSGDYLWNVSYHCFRADTLLSAYRDVDPKIVAKARDFIRSGDPADYSAIPVQVHEIEIIDSTKYPMAVIPARFGWSDIGNWQALHEILADMDNSTMVSRASRHVDLGSTNCLVYAGGDKLVATLGLDTIVIVDTPDALLVLNKDKPQEIKLLLEHLKQNGLTDYL